MHVEIIKGIIPWMVLWIENLTVRNNCSYTYTGFSEYLGKVVLFLYYNL